MDWNQVLTIIGSLGAFISSLGAFGFFGFHILRKDLSHMKEDHRQISARIDTMGQSIKELGERVARIEGRIFRSPDESLTPDAGN